MEAPLGWHIPGTKDRIAVSNVVRCPVRRIVYVCLLAVAALIPFQRASAQSVLQQSFADWSVQPSAEKFSVPFLAGGADGPVVQEFGYKSFDYQKYSRGKETLDVTLYQMIDPTAAYGAFTYFRQPNMASSKLTQYAAVSPNRALIVVGNFLLEVTGQRLDHSTEALEALVASVKSKADPRPYPSLAEHLPPNGMIPGSVRYAIGPLALQKFLPVGSGDWIGFSQGAEAVIARYHKGGQEVTVLVAEYPTQQIAGKRFDAMTPVVHPNPPTPETENRVVGSLREGDLIALAIASRAGEFPDNLLKDITFGHYVTSNEGKFTATEKSMPVYIVGAFVGAGAIMLIALFSGLGFAVVRIVVKKFYPGKVFDRRETMEVIQLGISDHKVNMKDFY
jgi:uncharacterized protein DUF6599